MHRYAQVCMVILIFLTGEGRAALANLALDEAPSVNADSWRQLGRMAGPRFQWFANGHQASHHIPLECGLGADTFSGKADTS